MSKLGKIFSIIISSILITSCNTVLKSKTIYHYNKNAKYVLMSIKDAGFMKEHPTLHFYDETGKELNNVQFEPEYEMSYRTAMHDALYFHGIGGLIKVDKTKFEVSKLIDSEDLVDNKKSSIDYIDYDEHNNLYLYRNFGLANDGKYKSKICKYEGECFDFDLPVASFSIKDDVLHVFFGTNVTDNGLQSYYKTYNINTKQELHHELKDVNTTMFKSDNMIYFQDKNGIKSIDGTFDYQYLNSKHRHYYDQKYIYVAYPKDNNQIELINIKNNTTMLVTEEDSFDFIIDEKTQHVIKHFYKDGYFVDTFTNKKITTNDQKKYGLFFLK